ncbi:unnamed protein product [Sordaria macrospora k-hell]|uniref:WGS project CABT00000000 data, contig 2.5 n=2 Tax=Sordaria macrospora TaxID=5147 RepID=F7VS71_SORMK|nr:uncharacterized protein SMAC_01905 [Sordaria macrospora k-hell]CCC08357.1 unnamed protein product [Sordaria macrospora k-hell]
MADFALPRMYGIPYDPRQPTSEYRKYSHPDKQSVSFWSSCAIIAEEETENNLSTLLRSLPPNTLGMHAPSSNLVNNGSLPSTASFRVTRGIVHGQEILEALDRHSGSLRRLVFAKLGPGALSALNQLRNCNALEILSLGASDVNADFDFARSETAVYDQCVEWLRGCYQLKDLSLLRFPSGTQLLKDSLAGPKLRLKSLTLVEVGASAPWYHELHHQAKLECLEVHVPDLGLLALGPASGRCQDLAAGISRCPELTELHAEDYLSVGDISKISEGALKLERISFSGTLVHDEHLMPLANLPRLKEVHIMGDSSFTASGILRFFDKMEGNADHDHRGFSFSAAFQQGTLFGLKEDMRLREAAERAFGGNVTFTYVDSDGEDYYGERPNPNRFLGSP